MKTIQNSAVMVVRRTPINDEFTGVLVERLVADDAGALRRTKIVSMSAVIVSPVAPFDAAEFDFNNPVIMVMTEANYAIGLANSLTYGISDWMDLSAMAVSCNLTMGTLQGTEGLDVNNVTSIGTQYDVVMPFTAYDALLCGTDFYIVAWGGAFTGDVRVSVVVERVEITQDEYMRYYATC
jgi:hypothetical protein